MRNLFLAPFRRKSIIENFLLSQSVFWKRARLIQNRNVFRHSTNSSRNCYKFKASWPKNNINSPNTKYSSLIIINYFIIEDIFNTYSIFKNKERQETGRLILHAAYNSRKLPRSLGRTSLISFLQLKKFYFQVKMGEV